MEQTPNISIESPMNMVYNYMNTLFKLRRNKINLYFNKVCNRKRITPKYIKINIRNQSTAAQKAKKEAERIWLKTTIQQLYTTINSITLKVYNLRLQIANSFHHLEYICIIKTIEQKVEQKMKKKRDKINKKLSAINKTINKEKLNTTSNIPTHKFYERIRNDTNIIFSKEETELLEKGLKHNVTPPNTTHEANKHLINIENSVLKTNIEHQQDIRTLIVKQITTNISKNQQQTSRNKGETNIAKCIKGKINEANAIITKADKGNTVVIMNKEEYNNKINDYIKNNNITKLTKDPTCNFQKTIKEAINISTNLLTHSSYVKTF